jgi:hypothetical protein
VQHSAAESANGLRPHPQGQWMGPGQSLADFWRAVLAAIVNDNDFIGSPGHCRTDSLQER